MTWAAQNEFCPLGSRPLGPIDQLDNVETVDEDPYLIDDDQDD